MQHLACEPLSPLHSFRSDWSHPLSLASPPMPMCSAGLVGSSGGSRMSVGMATVAMPWEGATDTAVIEYKNVRFVITESPTEESMDAFITELQRYNASYVVRLGGTAYRTERLLRHRLQVVDLPFTEGVAPSGDIIRTWCRLLRFRRQDQRDFCVAVHCAEDSLGRAPVLVAVALMELGMRCEDAVACIQLKRRIMLNAKQLDFLSKYRPKSRLSDKTNACIVM